MESPEVDLPDRDVSLAGPTPDSSMPADRDGAAIYSFPGGTRAGSFFHDVFEHHDFTAENPDCLENLVAIKQLKALMNEIDHDAEEVPLTDKNRFAGLLASLKGQPLNDAESKMVDRIIKK
jgi:hypothetical protein